MDQDKLIFYDIMGYPTPSRSQIFELDEYDRFDLQKNEDGEEEEPKILVSDFSWDSCNVHMSDYLDIIKKYSRLFRSIPFVKHIYLCNSITFNALNPESDIDILIITNHKKIRLARFFSILLFTIFGVRNHAKPYFNTDVDAVGELELESSHTKRQKFCLSFYVDEKYLNFYKILLQPIDIYFIYWLAHLVPLYTNDRLRINHIRKHNRRLKNYLPNHDLDQEIQIGNDLIIGNNKFKDIVEWIFGGLFGGFINKMIKYLWMPILSFKLKKLGPKKGWGVVISDRMLKFHVDMRKLYLVRYTNRLKRKT